MFDGGVTPSQYINVSGRWTSAGDAVGLLLELLGGQRMIRQPSANGDHIIVLLRIRENIQLLVAGTLSVQIFNTVHKFVVHFSKL